MNDCNCIDCQCAVSPTRYSHLRAALSRISCNKKELERLRNDLHGADAWFPASHVRYACREAMRQPNVLAQIPEGHPAHNAWDKKDYGECAAQVMWYIAFTHAGVE